MSVQILDSQVFNYLGKGLIKAFNSTEVNEWHFYSVQRHLRNKGIDIYQEVERIIKVWSTLNEASYCNKYAKNHDGVKFDYLANNIKLGPLPVELKPLQFIKYVECLIYNIEDFGENIPEYKLLKGLERDAKNAYINSLEDYKCANWSTI